MNEGPVDLGHDAHSAEYRRVRAIRRVLVVALGVLIVLLLMSFVMLVQAFEPVGRVATSAETGGIGWVKSIYGWGNKPEEQLSAPQAVAVGPDGSIWVTDAGQSRVMSFRPDGSLRSVLQQGKRGETGALSFPNSVAVDEAGLVYVGDMTGSQVVVMTADNEVVRRIQVPRPKSVAVRGDRLVVGADAGFVIMSKTGDVVRVLGTPGTGDTQFNGVAGVAIGKDGTIYVVDQYNNRVSAYTATGERLWIRVTGHPGNQTAPQASMNPTASAAAGMQLPSGIAIDDAGRLAVVDAFGFSIVILNASDGSPIHSYGEAGTDDGTFVYPSGIAYDSRHDWFVVADTSMDRVQIVRLPGSQAAGVAAVAAGVNRTLLGPAKALLIPLGVFLLIVGAAWGYRRIRSSAVTGALSAASGQDAGEAVLSGSGEGALEEG